MSKRVYYRVVLELLSALSIGAADSDQTDNDVVLDSMGLPVIPATSLAGVYRSFFYNALANDPEERCKRIFGELGAGDNEESAVRIYDATLIESHRQKAAVSIRDNVKLLREDKVADPGKKFDRQIVEAGAQFETFIEIVDTARCEPEDVEAVLSAVHSGELAFGSKTTRGFGRMGVVSCWKRAFTLPDDKKSWLMFDMFESREGDWDSDNTGSYNITNALTQPQNLVLHREDEAYIHLALRLRGAISVREYNTGVDEEDYRQMVVHGELGRVQVGNTDAGDPIYEQKPIIPGTTWAGAIRARYESFAPAFSARVAELFGDVDEKTKTSLRSRIVFEESVVSDGDWKTYTRNAIDRFTGGTVDEALFTERMYWCGHTALTIRIGGLSALSTRDLEPLIVALADLHNGFLAVGGLTSVGRGLFVIEKDDENNSVYVGANEITQVFLDGLFGDAVEGCEGMAIPRVTETASLLVAREEGDD